MVVATLQKIGQRVQYTEADKRNADRLIRQADGLDEFGSRLERVASREDGPQSEAIHADRVEQLLARLPNPDLRALVILRLAGHTNDEIAVELGFTRRTIQRMLNLIRISWDDLLSAEDQS
jgi:DNA-directed RNA polymerase specialized sigma24 family protein